MSPFILLLILDLIGLSIAIYLVWKRKRDESPVCIIGEECHAVLGSKYNKIFGIHNDVLGVFFYLGMFGMVTLLKYDIGPVILLLQGLKLMVGGGAVMAAIFMFLQWKVIKKWCFWCITSNINTWIIAYIVFNAI